MARKVSISPKTRRLGQRQRRVGEQLALRARPHLMHPMAELVRERHHVAQLALIVQQQIGMRRGHGRMREGARRLAGPRAGVDPRPLEEAAAERRQLRREGGVGVDHRPPRLVPGDAPAVVPRQRRVAVPVVEPVAAEPARLQAVVAVR
jgi:hypothetical protein